MGMRRLVEPVSPDQAAHRFYLVMKLLEQVDPALSHTLAEPMDPVATVVPGAGPTSASDRSGSDSEVIPIHTADLVSASISPDRGSTACCS